MTEHRKRTNGRIYFDDWSISDPDALCRDEDDAILGRAQVACHPFHGPSPERVTLSRDDVIALMDAAKAYHHLTTHPAGTEAMIQQLRAIRRVVGS